MIEEPTTAKDVALTCKPSQQRCRIILAVTVSFLMLALVVSISVTILLNGNQCFI